MNMTVKGNFPCSICGAPLDVRIDKKGKPYVICDPCGMQMFVRVRPGIDRFAKLVAQAADQDIWVRLAKLERRYRRTCAKCKTEFWIEDQQIKTSGWDGEFKGYACPKCGALVKVEIRKK